MPFPLFGPLTVLIHTVRPYSIHGDLYFECLVSPTDNPADRSALRLPNHLINPEPRPGETLTLTFLMGQVTGAKRPA